MTFNLIPLIIIVVSLALIIFIFARKIPAARLLDLETITEEKEAQTKKKLLESRLQRSMTRSKDKFKLALKPVFRWLSLRLSSFYRSIIELEKVYSKDSSKARQKPASVSVQTVRPARKKTADNGFAKKEREFIDQIEKDKGNLAAYRGLADLYMSVKDFDQALETLNFYIKKSEQLKGGLKNGAKHELACAHADVAEIQQDMDDLAGALEQAQQAGRLEPANPKFLDLVLKISIILRDKKLASETFQALKKANPENQKLPKLKKEVARLK